MDKMSKNREIWITGFALFALFFGAGNLILPPFLGVNSGNQWWLVFFGFIITAVFIPILGILAHAKVQGTMYDLGKKVAPWFSSLYCVVMYLIAVTIPAPRTASVAHEMAIQPFFGTSPLLTSSLYFMLIFIFKFLILDSAHKFFFDHFHNRVMIFNHGLNSDIGISNL